MTPKERTTMLEIKSLIEELLEEDSKSNQLGDIVKQLCNTDDLELATIVGKPKLTSENMAEALKIINSKSGFHYPCATLKANTIEVSDTIPDLEQMKVYRARLFEYTKNVFPKGWTVTIRAYVAKMFPGADSNTMTCRQWETLLDLWDDTMTFSGKEKLIVMIEDATK